MQQQRQAARTRTPHAPINPAPAKKRRGNWRTERVQSEVIDMGTSMGAMAAKLWPSVNTSIRFRLSNLAAYRDATMNDAAASLKNPRHIPDFKAGYMMGFEDEAMAQAKAGHKDFDGVAAGGSVDDEVRGNGLLAMAILAEGRLTKARAAAHKADDLSVMIQGVAKHMIDAARRSSIEAHCRSGEQYAALKAARKAAGLKDD